MSFVNQLEAVISKATNEYEEISTNNPQKKSTEDGTERGKLLDLIIIKQKAKKTELWTKLYKLQKERNKSNTKVFQEKSMSAPEKNLLTAMYESYELDKQIENEQDNLDNVKNIDEDVGEILFKEQLNRENEEYDRSIEFLIEETEKVRIVCAEEKLALSESKEVTERLLLRKKALNEANPEVIANKMKEHYAIMQAMLKRETKNLISFLDEYYPPHAINENDPLGEYCNLTKILEHLMNLSYTMPDSPYAELLPGTYWKPYIETLSKAGIIRYHPENATQICLEDFRI
ncbi:unnamed protein product [Rhizopus stolonifer]